MIPSINYVTAVLYNSLLRQRLRYEPKIVFGNMGDNSWPNKCNPIFSCITFSWKKSLLNSDSKYGANILFFIAINVVFCSSSSLLEIFFTLLVVKRKEKKKIINEFALFFSIMHQEMDLLKASGIFSPGSSHEVMFS